MAVIDLIGRKLGVSAVEILGGRSRDVLEPMWMLGHAAPEEDIEEARVAAVPSRRRLVDVLEEKQALDPDTFVARLGTTLHVPVMHMNELRSARPAFDILPFNECSQRG